MEISDLLEGEHPVIASWTYRVYERIRRQPLPDTDWRLLFSCGIGAAVERRDQAGLHATLTLAANYFDSIGDQFGCLPYIEETMQRVSADPELRAVVLACTHDILVGNS